MPVNKPTPKVKRSPRKNSAPAKSPEVLTLAETAAYFRVAEAEVLRLVREQNLPGRQVGGDWRFLLAGLRDWLRIPGASPSKQAVLASIGSWQDDPYLDELLEGIHNDRARPLTEDGR